MATGQTVSAMTEIQQASDLTLDDFLYVVKKNVNGTYSGRKVSLKVILDFLKSGLDGYFQKTN